MCIRFLLISWALLFFLSPADVSGQHRSVAPFAQGHDHPSGPTPTLHSLASSVTLRSEEAAIFSLPSRSVPSGQLVLGGLAGGALGLYAGAYAGFAVEQAGVQAGIWELSSEYVPAGALLGALIGETLLLPLGVHVANGRQGAYWSSALASAGVMAVGLLVAVPTGGVALLVIPVGQLYTSIRTERATAQRSAR